MKEAFGDRQDREPLVYGDESIEQPPIDSRVVINGDRIEVLSANRQTLAERGAAIYRKLGGQEETAAGAVTQLLNGHELRPRSGLFAIILKPERGVLIVEARNHPDDPATQAEMLAAVESSA